MDVRSLRAMRNPACLPAGWTWGRVLAEFRDVSNRHADAKSRKNDAGASPVTRTWGKHRALARYARNRRLTDTCYLWAFAR
jgi:hypothetical protein